MKRSRGMRSGRPGLPRRQLGALRIGDIGMVARRQRLGIADELLSHAERNGDQPHATALFDDEPAELDLHETLAEPEGGEQAATPALDRPANHQPLMQVLN